MKVYYMEKDNLIEFLPNDNYKITENDLKNLFMGLYKLAISNAKSEAEQKIKQVLLLKERELEHLRNENQKLLDKINNINNNL